MAYIKISKNKYKVIVEVGNNIDGKRCRKTKIVNGTREDAEKIEAEMKNKYYHIAKDVKINSLTFGQVSRIFIEKRCPNEARPITINNYKKSLKRIIPIIGDKKIQRITKEDLEDMYKKLKVGEKKEELGYHSMVAYYRVTNAIFNYALSKKLIERNPNIEVKKPKQDGKRKKNFYNQEQVNELLKCLENEHIKWRALIALALDSMCRRGEICALRWSDINFETHMLSINNSLKVVNGIVDEKYAKSNTSVREILLSNGTISLLKEYKKWQDDYIRILDKNWEGTDRVFTSKTGGYMHPDVIDAMFSRILEKNNLPHITFHGLRHTGASILLSSGINPKAVSDKLGHSDTSITLDVYAHTLEENIVASANIMQNLLYKN